MAQVCNDILEGAILGAVVFLIMDYLLKLSAVRPWSLIGRVTDGNQGMYLQIVRNIKKGFELFHPAPVSTNPLGRQPTGSGR